MNINIFRKMLLEKCFIEFPRIYFRISKNRIMSSQSFLRKCKFSIGLMDFGNYFRYEFHFKNKHFSGSEYFKYFRFSGYVKIIIDEMEIFGKLIRKEIGVL